MSIDTLVILSGAFVAVLPFLGFPSSWDKIIFLILGIFVLSLGIALRRRGQSKGETLPPRDVFTSPSEHHEAH